MLWSQEPLSEDEIYDAIDVIMSEPGACVYLLLELHPFTSDVGHAFVYGVTHLQRTAEAWHSPAAGRFCKVVVRE